MSTPFCFEINALHYHASRSSPSQTSTLSSNNGTHLSRTHANPGLVENIIQQSSGRTKQGKLILWLFNLKKQIQRSNIKRSLTLIQQHFWGWYVITWELMVWDNWAYQECAKSYGFWCKIENLKSASLENLDPPTTCCFREIISLTSPAVAACMRQISNLHIGTRLLRWQHCTSKKKNQATGKF